ncbi:uncharacterized protein LOC105204138 [Solenopsis invicta]|uniref:uncharacterized protein LOC105204138 n=1 Tax=Solenopsis invicta TaxID=13686 RepID=UPI00193CFF17|nr:uncharacterized protein LOC105204138 [Solenopsis invicta]
MICDGRTCGGCRYLEQDDIDERTASLAEFLANCQHAKCKVVRLVRQQISKLQNMQVRVPAFHVIGLDRSTDTSLASLKSPSGSYEHFLAASDVHDEAHEKTHNETPAEMHEVLDNEVHEVNSGVHEPYDESHELENKVEQALTVRHDKLHEAQKAAAVVKRTDGATNAIRNAATASLRRAASPGRAVDRKWMLRILDRVRHRAHLILAAAAVGVIVWTALVYGVFLGATACGSGGICFRSSLKYTHAKRTLF